MFFNIFISDLFSSISCSELYNYADDNTLLAVGRSITQVKDRLTVDSANAISWFQSNLMEANPDKFSFMLFGKDVLPDGETLKLNNVNIPCEQNVKLLGVTLDHKLNFGKHICDLAAKAGAQLSALTRMKRFLDEKSKLLVVKTFILSHFRYCPIIWHFCGRGNTNKLEGIQKRALKLAFGNSTSDYERLLNLASLTTLETSRQKSILIEVYKIINDLSPTYLRDLFTRPHSRYVTRNSNYGLAMPITKTVTYGTHSLKSFGTVLWNSVPVEIKTADSLSNFKSKLSEWKGTSCICSICDN